MSKRDGKYWDISWNPVKDSRGGYHCTKCSPGCRKCWAEKINLLKFKDHPYTEDGGRRTEDGFKEFILDEKVLTGDIFKGRGKMIFVCDLCDLFHPGIDIGTLTHVFDQIEGQKQHQFLVLTKRPERIKAMLYDNQSDEIEYSWRYFGSKDYHANIWLGVSVCTADEKAKIDVLRTIPAAHRFVSFGPLLENMGEINLVGIDWVVIEEESLGWRPGRPSSSSGNGCYNCVKPLIEQCKAYEVPVWVKQIHYQGRLIKNFEDLPVDVRVREYPLGLR